MHRAALRELILLADYTRRNLAKRIAALRRERRA
jgi:hypothetical protein